MHDIQAPGRDNKTRGNRGSNQDLGVLEIGKTSTVCRQMGLMGWNASPPPQKDKRGLDEWHKYGRHGKYARRGMTGGSVWVVDEKGICIAEAPRRQKVRWKKPAGFRGKRGAGNKSKLQEGKETGNGWFGPAANRREKTKRDE